MITLDDIRHCNKDCLTVNEVARVLKCDPNIIRKQAKENIKQLGFPAAKIGTRIKIPRVAFLNWFDGKL